MEPTHRPAPVPSSAGPAPTFLRPVPADDLGHAARQFLAHPGPRLLLAQTVGLWAWRARDRRIDRVDVATAAAVVAWWPLMEWLAHRWILHARPGTVAGRTVDLRVAQHHRAHHRDPWNPELTLLPRWFLAVAAPLHVAAWALVARDRRRAVTGMACFSTATLAYEWTHFLTHTSLRPKRSWYRTLQRRHRLHHFKDEHLWLGFTVPWVDDALGTAPDPATVPVSPTVRTLGVEVAP